MGGSSSDVVGAVANPIGYIAGKGGGAATGVDNLDPAALAKDQLIDKPKQAKDDIEKQIKQQEEEARKAEEEYQKEQSDAKKQARDTALQNLQRTQARLRSLPSSQKGGYSGTILTSPLGVSSDQSTTPGQKTLLGY
jgi:hypothetical protein